MPHPATIINPKWSERLKKLLAECKITQNELSKRIYLSQQTISKIKCGKAKLSPETAQKITEAFPKYRAEWLLGLDDIPYRFDKKMSELRGFVEKYNAAIFLLKNSIEKQGYSVDVVPSPNSAEGYDVSIVKLADDSNEFLTESKIIAEILDFVNYKADRLIKEALNNG